MSSNVAVFEADIDTSKLEAGSKRAKQSFEEIGSSGTRAFDSLQAQVQTLEAKIARLEQVNQKTKGSFAQLAGSTTGLITNLASVGFSIDNIDKIQLRATKTQRLYEEQLAKVNKMAKDGKQGTQEYAFEVRQLEELQQRTKQTQNDVNQAWLMNILTMTTLATSTIPNSIKAIQGLDLSLQTVRTTLWTIATHPVFLAVTGFFLAWEFGISKVIEKAAGLKDGEASIVQGLQKMWEGQNKVTSDGVSGFTGYTGAIEGTSSAIGSLGSGLDTVTEKTGKLITSYSQLVEFAKGGKGVNANDVAGNYNDLRKKFALDELPMNDFSNYDKFLDLHNVNFLRESDEKWNSIVRAINSANVSTKEFQSNLQIRIKQSGMFQDMKEYAEVIKDAHDVTRIKEFRKEIQDMAKDFRLSKDEAKELLDVFKETQKKSLDLKDFEVVNGKLVEITRNAHDAIITTRNLIRQFEDANFNIGKMLGVDSTVPFSGLIIGDVLNFNLELARSNGLLIMAAEALRDGDLDGFRELSRMAKEGRNTVGQLFNRVINPVRVGRNESLGGNYSQAMSMLSKLASSMGVGTSEINGNAIKTVSGFGRNTLADIRSGRLGIVGTSIGGGSPSSRGVVGRTGSSSSGRSKGRSSRHGGGSKNMFSDISSTTYKESLSRQSTIDQLRSLIDNMGLEWFDIGNVAGIDVTPQIRGYRSPSHEFLSNVFDSALSNYNTGVQRYNLQVNAAIQRILNTVNPLGISSLSELSALINNPLTTNDVKAQLEFQRRLASMSS